MEIRGAQAGGDQDTLLTTTMIKITWKSKDSEWVEADGKWRSLRTTILFTSGGHTVTNKKGRRKSIKKKKSHLWRA